MKKAPARLHAAPILLACLLTLCVVSGFTQKASAAGNILDLTYSTNGVTGYGNPGFTATAGRALAIQTDGKIVVAGTYDIGNGDTDAAVLRYNADGTPDTGFATNGMFSWGGSFADKGNAVAIQTDGKIVLVGTYNYGNGDTDVEVIRLNTNGSLDTSFKGPLTTGTGEIVLQKAGVDTGNAVAIQPDGKIVVVGTAGNAAWIIRLLSDGSYDTGFNTTGSIAITGNSGEDCTGNAVALQTDGKIVVTGSKKIAGGNSSLLVLRITDTGGLDNTFGTTGEVALGSNGAHSGNAVAIDASGKIVIVGTYDWTNDSTPANAAKFKDIWVQRLNSNGTPDTTFFINGGTGGETLGSTGNDIGNGVVIQPDGMIIVVGTFDNGDNTSSVWVHRLKNNGQPSATFNNGQSSYKLAGTGKFTGNAVALQTDKKIVVAGTGYVSGPTTSTILTMRLYGSTFPLTVTVTGSGTVTADSGTLTYDSNVGTEFYAPSTIVTLSPVPSNGNVFASWGGACNGSGACVVTMDAAKDVTATFVIPLLTVDLSSSVDGTGIVTSTPAGISCQSGSSANCSHNFTSDVSVLLTAFPTWDSILVGWGAACTDNGNGTCTVTMDQASKTVDATFGPKLTVMQLNTTDIAGYTLYPRIASDYTAVLPNIANNIDLMVQSVTFYEDLTYVLPNIVNFFGGKDANFTDATLGYTTVSGYLKIRNGRMNVNRLKIQPRGV